MYGFYKQQICSYSFTRLWVTQTRDFNSDQPNLTTNCKALTISEETKKKMGDIKSLSVHSSDKTLYVFSTSQAYVLTLPLKDSFEESLVNTLNLPNNPVPRQMSFLKPQSLIYLDGTNHLYFKQDLLNSDPPVKVKQDPIINGTILDKGNVGNGRDWVIVRGVDDFSGYIYRIYNWTAMSDSQTLNRNNEVTLGIDSKFDQAMVYNNSIVFIEKAFCSNDHNGKFMFYKTDLGGFVRSGLYEIKELGLKSDTGLLSLFYRSDPRSGLEVFHYDQKKEILIRSTFNVTDLMMACQPDDDLVRILPTTHTSYFLTLPKQNAIIPGDYSTSDERNGNTIIYIDHAIKWDNPINSYGYITWVLLGMIVIIFFACLVRNILGYKKDKELLNEITHNMQETEYNKSQYKRDTGFRPTAFEGDNYGTLGLD